MISRSRNHHRFIVKNEDFLQVHLYELQFIFKCVYCSVSINYFYILKKLKRLSSFERRFSAVISAYFNFNGRLFEDVALPFSVSYLAFEGRILRLRSLPDGLPRGKYFTVLSWKHEVLLYYYSSHRYKFSDIKCDTLQLYISISYIF